MLTDAQIRNIVDDFKTIMLWADQGQRLSQAALSEPDRLLAMQRLDAAALAMRHEAGRGDHSRIRNALDVMIGRHQLSLNEIERRQLGQALLLAGVEVKTTQKQRLDGELDGLTGLGPRPLDFSQLSEQQTVVTAIVTPSRAAGVDRITPRGDGETALMLSKISTRFLDEQRSGRNWDEQTLRQAAKTYRLAVEIIGDKPLSKYGRSDANTIKLKLQSLPADYGKSAIFRGKSLAEIMRIDQARNPSSQRLAMGTAKRHVNALSTLFNWAAREGMEVTNPFQGLSFPSSKRANEQREMWNKEDLQRLFGSPVWTGCKSAVRRAEPGPMIVRDEKFWLPLIALFSGMRQEEICQLQVEDIRQIDGYWCFDINARPPRKLKNKNAIRRVPIHPELKALGILDFADERRTSKVAALFPDLTPGGADGRLGHAHSKWFARYRQAIGVYKKGLDFHSLRHTATTLLQRAGVPIVAIDELTGHATSGETARYSHGLTVRQLAEAIATIDPAIDLSKLHTR